jgi:5-formyltetrahydrofolate cyclo-ligase
MCFIPPGPPFPASAGIFYYICMSKENWRKKLMQARQAMTDEEYAEKNQMISDRFMETMDWSKIRKVHIYRSVATWKEPDTSVIAEKIRRAHPKITVEYASLDKRSPIPEEHFDLIIIPVVGFDADNHRLGLGGGWYDRFLGAQPQALKIGLCFQAGFVKNGLPHEPHDIPLDRVITEV